MDSFVPVNIQQKNKNESFARKNQSIFIKLCQFLPKNNLLVILILNIYYINKFMIRASFQMLDKEYTDEDVERVYQKKLSEVNRKGKSISERMTNQTILKPYLYKLYQKMDEFGYNIRLQNEIVHYLYIRVGAYAKDLDSVLKFRERLYKEKDAGTLLDYRFFESKPL